MFREHGSGRGAPAKLGGGAEPLLAGSRASPEGEARWDPAQQGWGPDGFAGGAGTQSPLRSDLLPSIRAAVVTLVLTGLAYPLFMTGVAQLVFPHRAGGSIVRDGAGNAVGSELIAQGFSEPAYFHPRPSAAGEKGYDPTASGGSNLGPTSKKLQEQVSSRLEVLVKENPEALGPPPVELVTASGSGLDPHLSPAAALWQVPRVARARGVAPARVRALIEESAEGRELGVLGEPRVNVLALNLALDARFGKAGVSPIAR